MEKAVIKTLIYGDLFGCPMKAWEVHKWLINSKGSLREVEKSLNRLSNKKQKYAQFQKSGIVTSNKGYYYLANRRGLVGQRLEKQKQSEEYLRQAQIISFLFKIIPWVKLVGVSGSLSMENAREEDDIDLFVITQNRRIWLSRLALLLILELADKRRKRGEDIKKVGGKICINMLLEEDSLGINKKDLYSSHEVLQMRVLWQRGGVYSKFLEENEWVFKFLPNWTTRGSIEHRVLSIKEKKKGKELNTKYLIPNTLTDYLEGFFRWLQVRYMGKPDGKERISENALFFHPVDYREKVLKEFKQKLASLT